MEKLRKIRAKLTGRKMGKSSTRDKTLRHSRSMPLGPLRTSEDTEYSYSASSSKQLHDERVLDIRSPDWPKIRLREGREYDHQPDCDCWYCEKLLDEFPSPPPLRPRHRPRDLTQDFDDIEILPDAVYEARKKRRESEKEDEAERIKILHVVSSYRARVASSISSRSFQPIVVTDEEYDILRRYEPGFKWANRSTQSLGGSAHLPGGPRKPRLVRKDSRNTIGGSGPQIVNDRNIPASSCSHDGHGRNGSSVRSLRHQVGYRDLSRNSSVASRALSIDNASVRSPSNASSHKPPMLSKGSTSSESRRSNRSVALGSPPRGPRLQKTYGPSLSHPAHVSGVVHEPDVTHVEIGGAHVLVDREVKQLTSKPLPVLPLVPSTGSSKMHPTRK